MDMVEVLTKRTMTLKYSKKPISAKEFDFAYTGKDCIEIAACAAQLYVTIRAEYKANNKTCTEDEKMMYLFRIANTALIYVHAKNTKRGGRRSEFQDKILAYYFYRENRQQGNAVCPYTAECYIVTN